MDKDIRACRPSKFATAILASSAISMGSVFSAFAQVNFEPVELDADDQINQTLTTDLDSDGLVDVIISRNKDDDGSEFGGPDEVFWYRNLGNQNFDAPRSIVSTSTPVKAMTAGDIDQDSEGQIDLLFVTADGNAIWMENTDGSGLFWSGNFVTFNVTSRGFELADLDGDGDLDVVAVKSLSADEVYWLENENGDGSSWAQRLVDDENSNDDLPTTFTTADVDSDGELDIVAGANHPDHSVKWYRNRLSSGQGFERFEVDAGFNPGGANQVIAADVNADGAPDIVVSALHIGSTAAYLNIGNGASWVSYQISNTQNGAEIGLGDIDRDGDIDVLHSTYTSGFAGDGTSFAWYLNNGTGDQWDFFGHVESLQTSIRKPAISMADFDGNGYPDSVSRVNDDGHLTLHFAIDGLPPGQDSDGDGIPDAFELAFGLNPNDGRDGGQNQDDDCFSNFEEYLENTSPIDASSTPSELMGFDAEFGDWSSSHTTVSQDTQTRSYGCSSLRIVPDGFMFIESRDFKPADELANPVIDGDQIKVDIYIPSEGQEPWVGYLDIILRAPDQETYWKVLGRNELTGLDQDEWTTLSYPVDEETASALTSAADNVQIIFALNTNPNAEVPAYFLDNLRLGPNPAVQNQPPQMPSLNAMRVSNEPGSAGIQFFSPSDPEIDTDLLRGSGTSSDESAIRSDDIQVGFEHGPDQFLLIVPTQANATPGVTDITVSISDGSLADEVTLPVTVFSRFQTMDSLADWSSNETTLSLDGSVKTADRSSLNVPTTGYMKIEGSSGNPVEVLGGVDEDQTMKLDVYVPSGHSWLGYIELILRVPSEQVWWKFVHRVDLGDAPTDQFSTVSFELDAEARALLNDASLDDVEIKFGLNTPSGVADYKLDNLRFE